MSDNPPPQFSLAQQIDEVEYELKMRADVYGRQDLMKPSGAAKHAFHVQRLQAVLRTLTWLRDNEPAVRAATAGGE